MRFTRMLAMPLVTGAVVVSALAGAAEASAATERNGIVESGEMGFFHQSIPNLVFDLSTRDPDFSDDNFPGTSIPVVGNIGSLWNRDTWWWHVYTGRNFTGQHGCIPPGHVGSVRPAMNIMSAFPTPSGC